MDEARRRTRRRLITAAFSVAGHLALVFGLLSVQADAPRVLEPEPMVVQLIRAPPAPEPAKTEPAPAAAKPEPEKPAPPRRAIVRPTPAPPPDVTPRLVREAKVARIDSDGGDDQVSDAQLAGAATAGSGGGEGSGSGGGDCNMTRRLQSALRKDARVQAAVADALAGSRSGGKAILVWNGDWVRHGGQEGQGMAAVREAIVWEVGFAPKACRAEPMRGLVLISLNDTPGSASLVVGSDAWRWSDILFRRGAARR